MFFYIASFVICSITIIFCGTKLSKYGDIIAEKSGLGRSWIGVVLMASVTSLPELINGISSVTYANTPNIATGDVLGSCMFNILIIAFLDVIDSKTPLLSKISQGNVISAAFSIFLIIIVVVGFSFPEIPTIGWVGFYSIFIIIFYLIIMKIIFQYEKRQLSHFISEVALRYENISTSKAVKQYIINAFFVVLAAFFLPVIGEKIAELTGLGQTFVGNIFIATTTSLPEIVVSIAAVKIGAVDLAVGNLFGSNIFNIFILAVDDLLFSKGPILAFAEKSHLISALAAVAMTSFAIVDIIYKPEKKKVFIDLGSMGIVFVYLLTVICLYLTR